MDEVSVDGAVAAATYFLELYPYVYATGDLDEWQALSGPDCQFCASVISNVEDLRNKSSRRIGGELNFIQSWGNEIEENFWYSAKFRVRQAGETEFGMNGEVLRRIPGRTYDMQVVLTAHDSGWTVEAVEAEEVSE